MQGSQAVQTQRSTLLILLTRLLMATFIALISALAGLMLLLLGTRLFYQGKALPGVHADGLDLSGLDSSAIISTLQSHYTYPDTGTIALFDGEQAWLATPAALGVSLDFSGMAEQALAIGRRGGLLNQLQEQLDAWYLGTPVAPIVVFDQKVGARYLQELASEVERPMMEATVSVRGTQVEVSPGQIGRWVDIAATLNALVKPIAEMHDAALPLTIVEKYPVVLDASDAAESARQILSAPLHLTADEFEGLTLSPEQLAPLVRFERLESDGAGRYLVKLDEDALAQILEPLAPDLAREPRNARFIFNDDTRQLDLLEEAVTGRTLDLAGSIQAIQEGLRGGEHEIPLVFSYEEPAVGSQATAEELGITEAVSVVSTYFAGSSAARIQNIKTASSAFHGLLVGPGEVLSMADILGDISLDKGYAEALIIYGDRTIKGLGGGVCQVSTTLFRAAFFGGYEIVERHPHAYRVGYYEQGPGSPGPGLDATVFVPVVDFRFRNDTPYWLLLETYIYGNQLLWKFYSTSDGRTVSWNRTISGEVEAPKPLYKENPDLEKGEIKQIDYEADGMDVVVYRTVTRGEEVLHQDIIKTHYLPWRAIYEFGPGTKLPRNVEIEKS